MANERDVRKIHFQAYIKYETFLKIRKTYGDGCKKRTQLIEKVLEASVKNVKLTATELREAKKYVEEQYEKRMKAREVEAAKKASARRK